MQCQYTHHPEFEQALTCSQCHGPLDCGPFMHACRTCDDPFWFQKCLKCGVIRIECCC